MSIFVFTQMFNKLEQARAELTDLKDEFRREREDLEQTQEELTRELKLKCSGNEGINKLHAYFFFPEVCVVLHFQEGQNVQVNVNK